MKRRGYRHPAHTTEPATTPAVLPVVETTPTTQAFTSIEAFSDWLDEDLQSLETRFHDFVTHQSTRVAAGLSNKKSRQ